MQFNFMGTSALLSSSLSGAATAGQIGFDLLVFSVIKAWRLGKANAGTVPTTAVGNEQHDKTKRRKEPETTASWRESISLAWNFCRQLDHPILYRDGRTEAKWDSLCPEPIEFSKRRKEGKHHIDDGERTAATTNDREEQLTIYQKTRSI